MPLLSSSDCFRAYGAGEKRLDGVAGFEQDFVKFFEGWWAALTGEGPWRNSSLGQYSVFSPYFK